MKKNIKLLTASVIAAASVAFGGISVSATTADDVVAAARGAGIRSTYVAQLENFLRANSFTSDQYDKMIAGLGNIRGYSLDLIQKYYPEIQSYDDIFEGGGSSDDSSDPTSPTVNNLDDKQKPAMNDVLDKVQDNMTSDDMLNIINEVIETGKQVGLNVTVEQTGEKSYLLTAKDKDGTVKLVMPIGKLVSTTGVSDYDKSGFLTAAVLSASLLGAGAAGAYILGRKNRLGE